jgi:hypothetical protein
MAWTDIPLSHITFGLFTGSTPGATVTVAPADLQLCRYKIIDHDTVVIDVKIGKAFFQPANAAVTGITMTLTVPFSSVYFPALGLPSSFNDEGLTYTNDCIIAFDPGGLAHGPGCLAVLNESSHNVVLLVRTPNCDNVNAAHTGVVGVFGQVTFEIRPKG